MYRCLQVTDNISARIINEMATGAKHNLHCLDVANGMIYFDIVFGYIK